MKKIFSILLSVSLLIGVCSCALADEEITITNTEITAKNIPANGTIIAALYDGDNVLTGVRTYKGSETARYAEDMADELKISETIKVFVWDLETIEPLGRVYGDRFENLSSEGDSNSMTLTINGTKFTAELEGNETAAAFKERLPMTLNMSELNGNEKYIYLDSSLPSKASNPGTIYEGDIMLYGNSCVVVFYKTFNTSYTYTKIGHITDTTELADALGSDNVDVKFE